MMHCMSTSKPRITITLEPVTALQLKRLSELTGNSQSALVSDVLEQSSGVFERLIVVLEAVEQARLSAEAAKKSVRMDSMKNLDEAQKQIEKQMGIVLDLFEGGTAPLLKDLEKVNRRGSRKVGEREHRTRSGGVATPLSNRGVRSNLTAKKSTSQKRVKP